MFDYHELAEEEIEYVGVADVDELQSGDRLFIEIDGTMIALFNLNGEYFAIQDVCSHDDGPVAEGELEGYEIVCPRHGARFDVRSGEVLSLPAAVDIPAYPVRVEGSEIQIGVPRQE
jgi:3-phenylpropionate/trans-cinnamate dioxygenase ferredoxin subunit